MNSANLATLARVDDGGVPARRAMVRWAWRLFKREWRQQLLILALIAVAVTATIIGATVATDTPPPANSGFGTAHYRAVMPGSDPRLQSEVASLSKEFGPVDVIENETLSIPGSTSTYQLRSQSPKGPFGQPMLTLISGRYPLTGGEVALTPDLARALDLQVGELWRHGGVVRRVVGLVENPQNLLNQFALVLPGQITAPTSVTVLFGANVIAAPTVGLGGKTALGVAPDSLVAPGTISVAGLAVQTASSGSAGGLANPATISITVLVLGLLLIALVAVGGFTVVAQRRMRAFGILESLGATDKNVKLVVKADGVIVGLFGALAGVVLALIGWFAYRPILESSSHHLIGVFAMPWTVVVAGIVLAISAAYFAASLPARSLTHVSIAASLSGRPAPPRQIHRSAVPGLALLAVAFVVTWYAGKRFSPELLIIGLTALVAAVVLLSPMFLAALGRAGRDAPVSIRLAFRDLARYRARSGSVLAAVSLGILISVMISGIAAVRYSNVLDYVGPNLAPNQLVLRAPPVPSGSGNGILAKPGLGAEIPTSGSRAKALAETASSIAKAAGISSVVELESANATLQHGSPGRNWMGPIYVATPQLLETFGINPSEISSGADILTMRPGLSTLSKMQLVYGSNFSGLAPPGSHSAFSCPQSDCLANPVIEDVKGLPSGTSAPNTVITQAAVRKLGLSTTVFGWLMQSTRPLTNAQISSAQQAAVAAGMVIETRNDLPTSSTIISWATAFGIALAIAILAMSVGLLRSETASDLRILAATGASSFMRRNITAATAGALAFLGAILGTIAGYVGVIGWFMSSAQGGGISSISNAPVESLVMILVAMPLLATLLGWLLAGRNQPNMARQPIE